MLFPLKKNKWQHTDPVVRLAAVAKMDPSQIKLLLQIALQDGDGAVREAATVKLEDLATLDRIAGESSDPRVAGIASRKGDEKRALLLREDGAIETHLEHLSRINSTAILIRLACTSFHVPVRLRSLERLHDQSDLQQVGMGQCGRRVAEALIDQIDALEVLSRLSQNGGSKLVRRLAAEKLTGCKMKETPEATDQTERLQQLIETANRLSTSLEWDLARQRLQELKTEWERLAGFHFQQLSEQFSKAVARFEQRDAAYQESLEKERQQEDRMLQVDAQFADILQQIMQVSPADGPSAHSAIADYRSRGEELLEKMADAAIRNAMQIQLADACRQFDDKLSCYNQEFQKSVEFESLLTDKEMTIHDPSLFIEVLNSLQEIIEKEEWHQFDPIALREKINTKKTALSTILKQTQLEKQRQEEKAATAMDRLTSELGELKKNNDMTAAMPRFREIDTQFHAIVSEPSCCPPERIKRYRAERARFLVRQRDYLAMQEWHIWANRSIKEKLIDETTALDAMDDLANVFNRLKQLQTSWKETGPAGAKEDRRLWQRFHEQCERQFDRCRPYLEEVEKKRLMQVERFNAIVEEAKSLSGSDSWQNTARQFQTWQDEIKTFTEVPASIRQDLFHLFRKEANTFFERRRQYQEQLESVHLKNYQLKEELCQEAENLASEPKPDYGLEFKRLQKEWKKIPPVPRKKEQQLWQRFRKACDQFFDWLNEARKVNLDQKRTLLEKAAAIAEQAETADDFRPLAEELATLQKQWNDVGPVPRDESRRMLQLFRDQVERFYAVRQQSLATLQDEKRQNQLRKEEILEDIEKLVDSIQEKEATERIKILQKQFHAIGPCLKGEDKRLREQLKTLCDHFFRGRSNYFAQLQEKREEVLRGKEALIFELQQLINYTPRRAKNKQPQTLDLAAQLKLALESNFSLAERDKGKARLEEINRIRKKWKGLEKLPARLEKELQNRFQETLDYYERQNRAK